MRYWIDFKKLRGELSFEKIFEQYSVKLHTKGEQATGPCPLPNHTGDRKTDSFSANIPKGIFQCFSCHAKGNVLDFAVLMEGRNPKVGTDLRQTGIELAKRYGLQNVGSEQKSRQTGSDGVSYVRNKNGHAPANTAKAVSAPPPQKEPLINTALPFTLRDLDPKHPYLTDRGLTPETIRQFGLGFCSRGRLNGRIAIPIHDWDGHLIAYAGRLVDEGKVNSENPKYLFPGSRVHNGNTYEFRKSLIVYNAHRVKPRPSNLIIVEGFASVWWLTQNGFPNCVALMGSSLSDEQTNIIGGIVGDRGHVTVLTDGDAPGMRCHDEIRAKLSRGIKIHRPTLNIGAQPTDFTKDELESIIRNSEHDEDLHHDRKSRAKTKNELISNLISQFPCLANLGITAQNWNPEEFDKRSLKFSSGERAAAQFVLGVWNPRTKWEAGRFDVIEAAARLDGKHLEIINTWLKHPWWP